MKFDGTVAAAVGKINSFSKLKHNVTQCSYHCIDYYALYSSFFSVVIDSTCTGIFDKKILTVVDDGKETLQVDKKIKIKM